MCEEVEDTDHILKCASQSAKDTFNKQLEKIIKNIRKHTSQEMVQSMKNLLQRMRNNEQHTGETVPDCFERLINMQLHIGNRETIVGVWHKQWFKEQNEYIRRTLGKSRPKTFFLLVTLMIQDLILEMWFNCNEQLHKSEKSKINQEKHSIYNIQVDKIYTQIGMSKIVHPSAKLFFSKKKTDVKRM